MRQGESSWTLRVTAGREPERRYPIVVDWTHGSAEGRANLTVGRPGLPDAHASAPIAIKRRGGAIWRVEVGYPEATLGVGRTVKGAVEDWASQLAGDVAHGGRA